MSIVHRLLFSILLHSACFWSPYGDFMSRFPVHFTRIFMGKSSHLIVISGNLFSIIFDTRLKSPFANFQENIEQHLEESWQHANVSKRIVQIGTLFRLVYLLKPFGYESITDTTSSYGKIYEFLFMMMFLLHNTCTLCQALFIPTLCALFVAYSFSLFCIRIFIIIICRSILFDKIWAGATWMEGIMAKRKNVCVCVPAAEHINFIKCITNVHGVLMASTN